MASALNQAPTRPDDLGPSSVQLVEESFHHLRSAPVGVWFTYALGALPWVFLVLYFWARTNWFAPTGPEIALEAGLLAIAFIGLKTAQARFSQSLAALRIGEKLSPYSVSDYIALGLRQLRLQAWGIVILPLATVAMAPFALTFAFYQNLSALSNEPEPRPTAWKEATRWSKQNWFGLGLLGFFALMVWINLATAFYIIPWMANHLLGMQNLFAVDGWFAFNTTFFVSVTALTWLVVDPLIKSFYVLRLFYGRSQRTGEDILIAFRKPRLATRATWIVLFAFILSTGASHLTAKIAPALTPAPVSTTVKTEQIDRAIDDVMRSPEFRWRLHGTSDEDRTEHNGPFRNFVRQTVDLIESVGSAIKSLYERIRHWFDSDSAPAEQATFPKARDSLPYVKPLLIVLIAIAVGLLGFLIFSSMRRRPDRRIAKSGSESLGEEKPDLRDENVQAAQLPADGWLKLAQQEMAKGEWRWALRALYLATLAQLGAEGLITLAKFKTNAEYERELHRRAPSQSMILARFGRRRSEFEQVWYGQTAADESRVRDWLGDFSGVSR